MKRGPAFCLFVCRVPTHWWAYWYTVLRCYNSVSRGMKDRERVYVTCDALLFDVFSIALYVFPL